MPDLLAKLDADLRRDVQRLRDELAWYGDIANYTPQEGIWTDAAGRRIAGIYTPVIQDGGERARKALGISAQQAKDTGDA